MATYKEIYGSTIEVVTSDPENPVTGQIWYNSTDNVVKGAAATTAGAWATEASMNTQKRYLAGAGTKTAAMGFGGITISRTTDTELFDGTSWTEVNNMNTARAQLGGTGTQTSALGFAGSTPPYSALNESWNGTSWTEVADLNTARQQIGNAGADNTSALAFGGYTGSFQGL